MVEISIAAVLKRTIRPAKICGKNCQIAAIFIPIIIKVAFAGIGKNTGELDIVNVPAKNCIARIGYMIKGSTLALSVYSGGVANLIQQVSKQIVSGIDEVICFR